MGYWPTYADINPQARAAYLSWLAGGRRDPNAYIGYVFLFFYGLERRALVDIPRDSSLLWEVPHLRAEVQRLLGLYRSNNSFRGYASRFLDVLDLQGSQGESGNAKPPPLEVAHRYEPPTALAVEIGSFAADGKPVPADWALAWAWYHPEIHLRTPATRCPEEFATLFKARYTQAHRDGIIVRATKKQIGVEYYAASAGIRSASLSMNIPDVFTAAVPTRQLAKIVDSVTEDLDPYSRYLGRNPDGRHSLAAAALLPEDLAGDPDRRSRSCATGPTGSPKPATPLLGADLMDRWPTKSPDRMAKNETVTLAQLLGRYGYGHRARCPARRPSDHPCHAGRRVPHRPPASPGGDTGLRRSGDPAPSRHRCLRGRRTRQPRRTGPSRRPPGDGPRAEPGRTRPTRGAPALAGRERCEAHRPEEARRESSRSRSGEAIGDLLVAVAAADGVISPEEITSLTKIYQLLDARPGQVHTRLHAHLTGARPAPATGAGHRPARRRT